MNRRFRIAVALLASGAIVVTTTGCFGDDGTPATTTVETEAPAPTTTQAPATVTEQTTVTDDDNNDNDDDNDNNDNNDDNDQDDGSRDAAAGEAVGKAEEQAGLSKAKQECLRNASAADCANIP